MTASAKEGEPPVLIDQAIAHSSGNAEGAPPPGGKDGPVTVEYRVALAQKADRYGWGGMVLIAVGILLTVGLMTASWIATSHYVEDLNNAEHATETLVLLLARGTAFGAAGTGLIIAVLLFARACMDQSARFRKRWFSAPVFNEAMRLYLSHPHDEMGTEDVIKLFESWNKTVDSPFANIKLRAKPQNVSINASRGTFFMGEEADSRVQTKPNKANDAA